jgi:hypothetical protein
VVSLHVRPRRRKHAFDAPVPCHAYPAKYPPPRKLSAQPLPSVGWLRVSSRRSPLRQPHLTVDQLADEFARLSVKPVIRCKRLPKRPDHPLNAPRRLHPPTERPDRSAATRAYTVHLLPAPLPYITSRPISSVPVAVRIPVFKRNPGTKTSPALFPSAFQAPTLDTRHSLHKRGAKCVLGTRWATGISPVPVNSLGWRESSLIGEDAHPSPRPSVLHRPSTVSSLVVHDDEIRPATKRARSRTARSCSPFVDDAEPERARKRARMDALRPAPLNLVSAESSPASSFGPLTPDTPTPRALSRKVAPLPRRIPTSDPNSHKTLTREWSVASFRSSMSVSSSSDGSVIGTPPSATMALPDNTPIGALRRGHKEPWILTAGDDSAGLSWIQAYHDHAADSAWFREQASQIDLGGSMVITPRSSSFLQDN